MKHCPNAGCPDRISKPTPSEFVDDVETCPACGTPLRDGPAPSPGAGGPDHDPVTIARFFSPHDAHLARIALESHGVEGWVHFECCQYCSTIPWIHLQTERQDAAVAIDVLERGPVITEDRTEAAIAPPAREGSPEPLATEAGDDLAPLRLERRFGIARWFLWVQAVGALPWVLVLVPVFVVPAGLALWSKTRPRPAFAVALGVQVVFLFVLMAATGPIGIGALGAVLAVYFAWIASRPDPPTYLLASPYAAIPSVPIGDAWDVPPVEPEKGTSRLPRSVAIAAGILMAAVLVVWVGWAVMRPAMMLLVHSTEISLIADADSALLQELRLGQARLDHELRLADVRCEAIELSMPDTLEVRGVDPAATERVGAAGRRLFPDWTIETTAAGTLRLRTTPLARDRIVEEALDDTLDRLGEEHGAALEAVEEPRGTKIAVRLRLPGDWPRERIRELFPDPVTLEFREVVYPEEVFDPGTWMPAGSPGATISMFGGRLPPGTEIVPQPMEGALVLYWPLRTTPVVVGRDLVEVLPRRNEWDDAVLDFGLSAEAGRRLEAATSRILGRKMAVVLLGAGDARVVTAPRIQSVISDRGYIQGSFTMPQVHELALQLESGSRAIWLTPAER